MTWKSESKRHSIAKKYGRVGSKKTTICPLSSSQTDILSQVDFSKAPDNMLEEIVLDKTASKVAQDKAFDELTRREHNEHPWTTDEQARQIVNDHLAKVKLKVFQNIKDIERLKKFYELDSEYRNAIAGTDEANLIASKLLDMGADWSDAQGRFVLRAEESRFMKGFIDESATQE